jgi:ATP adenylyltransferase
MFRKRDVAVLVFMTLGSLHADWNAFDASKYRKEYQEKCFAQNGQPCPQGCVFCRDIDYEDDKPGLILKRFDHVFVKLAAFPYRQGHVLVLPNRHVARLQDLTEQESLEFIIAITLATKCLKEEYKTDGHNVGINEGRAAGASQPDHLHCHIVPRWHDDVSFIHIIGETTVISEAMETSFNRLKEMFDQKAPNHSA